MSKKYEQARDKVHGLQAQIATMQTGLQAAVLETERLTTEAGAVLADGGDASGLETQIATLVTKQRTTSSALSVLEGRLVTAKSEQRASVVFELRAMADKADVELKTRTARVNAAETEFRAALGLPVNPLGIANLTWGPCDFEHLQQRPDLLRGAAVFVEQGRDCMRDPETGTALDKGLW